MNNLTQEQINQLLKYAINGYWSALQPKLDEYEFSLEVKELLKNQLDYQEEFQQENRALTNPRTVADYQRIKEKNKELEQELTTEKESTQQALQTSQEWHERQKEEIIAEWKQKLQTFINKRKATIQQEITLIKEILSHDM